MNDIHDLAALYVVDALMADEIDAFENHLAGCAACQQDVLEMRAVTNKLSRSVEAEPPASLRSSVLAEIATVTQERPPVTAEDTAQEPSQPAAEVTPITSRADRRPGRPSRVSALVAAAAVLLAVGFGGWALQSRHDAQQATSAQNQLVELLAAPDARTVSAPVPGGSGTVVLSDSRHQAAFVTSDMSAPASGKVYQVWTITTKAASAGTFSPGAHGAVVTLPAAALSANQIAITVEPSGGSAQPTTKPVMAVQVPR